MLVAGQEKGSSVHKLLPVSKEPSTRGHFFLTQISSCTSLAKLARARSPREDGISLCFMEDGGNLGGAVPGLGLTGGGCSRGDSIHPTGTFPALLPPRAVPLGRYFSCAVFCELRSGGCEAAEERRRRWR